MTCVVELVYLLRTMTTSLHFFFSQKSSFADLHCNVCTCMQSSLDEAISLARLLVSRCSGIIRSCHSHLIARNSFVPQPFLCHNSFMPQQFYAATVLCRSIFLCRNSFMPQHFLCRNIFCAATFFVPRQFLCRNSLTRCDDSCTATSSRAATFPCTVTTRKVRNNFAHTRNDSPLYFFSARALYKALYNMVTNNDRIQPKIRRIQHNWPEVDEATLVSDFGAEAACALRFLDTLGKASLSLQYREVVQGATEAKNVRSPSSSTPFKAKDVQSVINSNPSAVHIGRSDVSCPPICNISLPFHR